MTGRCLAREPRVGWRYTARMKRPNRGRPLCRRPAGHDGCHMGDGWIWGDGGDATWPQRKWNFFDLTTLGDKR